MQQRKPKTVKILFNFDVTWSQRFSGFTQFYLLFPQENSKWRRHYLNSAYEYMHAGNKEQGFLVEEQEKIRGRDWSDHMVDPPDVRRQYEVSTDGLLKQNNKI